MHTLFYSPEITVQQFKLIYNVDVSVEFIRCADQQLTAMFIQKAGLKFGKNLSISWVSQIDYFYETGVCSRLPFYLYVNHNWNPITITWKSASGRIYKIDETDIDCADIAFSFESLDIPLYHKQMYPGNPLPFKLKDLSFELTVHRINVDCEIAMELRTPGTEATINNTIKQINDFIEGYNEASGKKDWKYGVVHNYKINSDNKSIISYELDLGSTGADFIKKLLEFISTINAFSRITFE